MGTVRAIPTRAGDPLCCSLTNFLNIPIMRLTTCILSASLALGACASPPTSPPASPPASLPASPALEGTSWRLASFQSNDAGATALQPRAPDQFTLSFGKDGRLAAKLDCNRGSGPWQAVAVDATGGTLNLGPVATTRAMCPPDAIGSRLTADLAAPGRAVSTQVATDAVLERITRHCQVTELRD